MKEVSSYSFFDEFNCPNCEGNSLDFEATATYRINKVNNNKVISFVKKGRPRINPKAFCQCNRCGYFGKIEDFILKKPEQMQNA